MRILGTAAYSIIIIKVWMIDVYILVMSFVVTGGRSWSFQTPNLDAFKTEQKNLFVLISLIMCADIIHLLTKFCALRICE